MTKWESQLKCHRTTRAPRRSRLRAGLALAVMASAAACGRPHEYVVGAAGPLGVAYGIQNREGIELARDEINAAGGIDGVPLRIDMRDDHANGADAARIAGAFVADPHVIAVVGHAGSGAEVSAAHVYDGGQLAAVATTPSSPDLTGVSPWVFRMITSDSVNGVKLARFASSFADSLHHPVRAAVLYNNDAYGRGFSASFLNSFRGVVVSTDPWDPTRPRTVRLVLQEAGCRSRLRR